MYTAGLKFLPTCRGMHTRVSVCQLLASFQGRACGSEELSQTHHIIPKQKARARRWVHIAGPVQV